MCDFELRTMKEIARLLRFIGNTGCLIASDPVDGKAGGKSQGKGEAKCLMSRPGRPAETFAESVLRSAVKRGLVLARDNRIFVTTEARSFLRRYLAAREEAFLDQHRTVEIAEIRHGDSVEHVRVNGTSSPLSSLARLRDSAGAAWFPGDALSAGERLSRDFLFANLQPKITPSYEPRLGNRTGAAPGAGVEMKDSVVAARMRVSRAVEALGPELSGVALDICCFEKGLELVERERQWPARSAKLMLKTALLQLHRHYHPAPAPTRKTHAWGADGFRPEIGG